MDELNTYDVTKLNKNQITKLFKRNYNWVNNLERLGLIKRDGKKYHIHDVCDLVDKLAEEKGFEKAEKEFKKVETEYENKIKKLEKNIEKLEKEQEETKSEKSDKEKLDEEKLKYEIEIKKTKLLSEKSNLIEKYGNLVNRREMEKQFENVFNALRENLLTMSYKLSNTLQHRDMNFIKNELGKSIKETFEVSKSQDYNTDNGDIENSLDTIMDSLIIEQDDENEEDED